MAEQITASEVIRRQKEWGKLVNSAFKKATPLERLLFLAKLQRIGQSLWRGPTK